MKQGKFREDLYYRLNVFSIVVPPLRERRADIPILAYYFLNKFTTTMNKPIKNISKEAMDFLVNYDWPGNVRELENAIERAVVVGKKNSIEVPDLPFHVSSSSFVLENGEKSLSAMEKKYIIKILEVNNWNITRSAQVLEIDRVTLYNKISKYNCEDLNIYNGNKYCPGSYFKY